MIAVLMNSLNETKFLLGHDIPFGLQAAPYDIWDGYIKKENKNGKIDLEKKFFSAPSVRDKIVFFAS